MSPKAWMDSLACGEKSLQRAGCGCTANEAMRSAPEAEHANDRC
jgi:hypothetical protein